MNDHLSRFQALLREIFQFDFADLDTGIYRLFRLPEKELRRFIDKTLPAEVGGGQCRAGCWRRRGSPG